MTKAWKPEPPPLGDKFTDWEFLVAAGGDDLFLNRDVLDVGPLWGIDAALFATRAHSYTVIDSAAEVLDQVHRIAPTAIPVQHDVCQPWPFADATFDTVIDFSTLDDTARPDLGYKEIARVLRPGGVLLTSFANSRKIDVPVPFVTVDPHDLAGYLTGLGFNVRAVGRREQARATIVAIKHGDAEGRGTSLPTPELLATLRGKLEALQRRRHDTDTAHDLRDVHALVEALALRNDKETP